MADDQTPKPSDVPVVPAVVAPVLSEVAPTIQPIASTAPVTPVTTAVTTPVETEGEKILGFIEKLNSPISVLWSSYKWFLLTFGVLILIIRFKDVIMDLLVSSAKREVDSATKKSDVLLKEENDANAQANQLRADADKLTSSTTSVGEDWNKK